MNLGPKGPCDWGMQAESTHHNCVRNPVVCMCKYQSVSHCLPAGPHCIPIPSHTQSKPHVVLHLRKKAHRRNHTGEAARNTNRVFSGTACPCFMCLWLLNISLGQRGFPFTSMNHILPFLSCLSGTPQRQTSSENHLSPEGTYWDESHSAEWPRLRCCKINVSPVQPGNPIFRECSSFSMYQQPLERK